MKKHISNNLYLIISEDDKLINFYKEDIINKNNLSNADKITIDMQINNVYNLLEEALMTSLFSPQKVIIANNFNPSKISDNEKTELESYFKNYNESSYIIMITNKLDSRTSIAKILQNNLTIISPDNLNNQDNFLNYIKESIKKENYQMTDININYFLTKVGENKENIDNELSKLKLYKIDNKIITNEDIDLLIEDNIDTIIYEFTNAIIDNDKDKVTKMGKQFKNLGFDYLLTSISNSIRTLLIILLMKNNQKSNQEIAKYLNKKEFFIKKSLSRLSMYQISDLTKYLDRLYKIDDCYKRGKSNFDYLSLFTIIKE